MTLLLLYHAGDLCPFTALRCLDNIALVPNVLLRAPPVTCERVPGFPALRWSLCSNFVGLVATNAPNSQKFRRCGGVALVKTNNTQHGSYRVTGLTGSHYTGEALPTGLIVVCFHHCP